MCHRDRYAQCEHAVTRSSSPGASCAEDREDSSVQFFGEVVDAPVVVQRQVPWDGPHSAENRGGAAVAAFDCRLLWHRGKSCGSEHGEKPSIFHRCSFCLVVDVRCLGGDVLDGPSMTHSSSRAGEWRGRRES